MEESTNAAPQNELSQERFEDPLGVSFGTLNNNINEPSNSKVDEHKKDNKIILNQINGIGYCFNVEDYMKIRREHRICGSFMGTNHMKSYGRKKEMIPIEFNEYETQLLLDEKIAILVSKSESFTKGANIEDETKLLNEFEKRIEKQGRALNEKKLQETIKNISKVMAGKRKKLLNSGIPEKDIKLSEDQVIQEIRANMKFDKNNAQLEIPNQCLYDHEAKIVNFQVSDLLGYQIFRDIWKKGEVYVTLGGNFGGNFLIYPGDPLVYHASHIVYILKNPAIQPLDMISRCRLTVNVNKICVLAYVDLENNIKYQTVHWEGNIEKSNFSDDNRKIDESDKKNAEDFKNSEDSNDS